MRFAIIGTSAIARRFASCIRTMPNASLAAVYSRSKLKADTFAASYTGCLAFDTLQQIADCELVDAVYVASPTAYHAFHSISMLEALKHVLCEKPLASNSKELQRMFDAAHTNKRVLLEAMRPMFMPSTELIASKIASIEPVRQVKLHYCQYSSRYDDFKQGKIENAFDPNLSNGALMDIGVYVVHMLMRFFGPPQSILASDIKLSNGIDGAGSVIASYPTMQASLVYSKIGDSVAWNEIIGEQGTILFDHLGCPRTVHVALRGKDPENYQVQNLEEDMYYELNKFIQLCAVPQEAQSFNQYSRQTLMVLDQIRAQVKIEFSADLL